MITMMWDDYGGGGERGRDWVVEDDETVSSGLVRLRSTTVQGRNDWRLNLRVMIGRINKQYVLEL